MYLQAKSNCKNIAFIALVVIAGILSLFSFAIPSITDKALAQNSVLTDSDAPTYYSNPNGYVNNKVNSTGQIFNFPPLYGRGANTLQMYQEGDTNKNTIIFYNSPIQLTKDDCIRVIGVSQPLFEYENNFGAKLSTTAIKADSVTKIDCSESLEPSKKTVDVEQTKEENGVKITLYKVEFSDKNTRVYLSVENTGPSEDITFYDYKSRAIQGKTQFITTNSYQVNYPKIESTIPAGIVETGVVLFEPLDPTQDEAQFRFDANNGIDVIKFTFDVIVPPTDHYEKLSAASRNSITALSDKGNALIELGNYTEAIKYFDKILEINPNHINKLDSKGYSLYKLGKIKESIEVANKAIKLDFNYANTWYNRAIYYANENRIDESIADLKHAIALDKKYGYESTNDKDFEKITSDPNS